MAVTSAWATQNNDPSEPADFKMAGRPMTNSSVLWNIFEMFARAWRSVVFEIDMPAGSGFSTGLGCSGLTTMTVDPAFRASSRNESSDPGCCPPADPSTLLRRRLAASTGRGATVRIANAAARKRTRRGKHVPVAMVLKVMFFPIARYGAVIYRLVVPLSLRSGKYGQTVALRNAARRDPVERRGALPRA